MVKDMSSIPIFLASDENYAPFVATTIASIVSNTKSFVDFYVLDSGISERSKRKIDFLKKDHDNFSIEYIEIDLQKLFGHFPLHNEAHTLNVFSRYLIPNLKEDLSKVLYLDVDIIVQGDIKDLHEESLGKYHLGAVPEYTDVLDNHKKSLGLSEGHKYFNAGILLIDCAHFRENDLMNALIQKTLEIKPQYQDQDILNIYFENNYKILDYKYNVSGYMQDYQKKAFNDIVQKAVDHPFIIHYTTFKPWSKKGVVFEEFFWRHAQKTAFYESLLACYVGVIGCVGAEKQRESVIKLFGFIPFLFLKKRDSYIKVFLFRRIPFLKMKRENDNYLICFLSWKLILFKISVKLDEK